MTEGRAIEELDLLAYADGLLDSARQEEVEAFLQQNPQAAARVAEYVAQNHAIRAAFGGVANEPVPARVLAAFEKRRSTSRWRQPLQAATLVASLAAAGFIGWVANEPSQSLPQPSEALVEASMALHADWSPSPQTVADSGDGSILLPNAVAAEQEGDVTLRIPPPDLSSLGLRLVGLRGVGEQGGPGAQLIYSDARGDRVSLFLMPSAGGGAPPITWRQAEDGRLAFWQEGPITFALVGENVDRSAGSVVAQVRGALRSAPLRVLPPSASGSGMTAESGGGMADRTLRDVPLLRPTPVGGETGRGAM